MEGDIGGEVPCSSFAVDSALRVGTVGNIPLLLRPPLLVCAGLIWGSCTGSLEATKLGLTGITRASFAKSAGRYGIQWGLFATVLSFTRCGLQRYRGQHDWVNPVVAGAVAGTVIGASARNWKQAAGVSGLVCALYYAAEDAT
ncbi:outer envelope pore protein 16-4, chloroplastic isoform X2 [Coffea eugenioides]|uniref:Outer envelope pore protein 16-4, chloroplastic-like isoform X2 n=1 Tax=Coffea arabica TaxID=13443 RepID=A0A6P6V759_COFAR|nr:outer envelope pore protein 16-4, chloroplastic-like isoform X2 [Coffea arabica]XP_027117701.1 outer envelope pore protein 16-4, chloroplastic-like isoform X5 [Coffea arabica]XP_027148343.1 outer envelope pore protein 16-4, chloroplastic isoform X2 [Coffea eugenioides]